MITLEDPVTFWFVSGQFLVRFWSVLLLCVVTFLALVFIVD